MDENDINHQRGRKAILLLGKFINLQPGGEKENQYMEKSFQNKVIIITGGSIGRATAVAFAKRGANVAIVDFRPEFREADSVAFEQFQSPLCPYGRL